MDEKLLQFIWQYKLFDCTKINKTTQGDTVEIYTTGSLNTNAGPDFTNAKIKINNTIWAGNIELHLKASDWLKHNHQTQENYNKIILHVVLENDIELKDISGNVFPTIILSNAINKNLVDNYKLLMRNSKKLACSNQINNCNTITIEQQLERALIERLQTKANRIQELLDETNNDWTEVFYISIARAFGSNVNGDAFQALAIRTPLKILAKQKNNLLQLQAILFGVAGLLPLSSNDLFIKNLIQEFALLKAKFNLISMDGNRFKFSTMRPPNFPTIRIAQLASLIHQASQLMSKVLDNATEIEKLEKLFNVTINDYWEKHFTFFDEEHPASIKKLGKTSVHHLLINTICPILYQYGKFIGEEKYCEQAINLLQLIPAEKNQITKLFSTININSKNAFQSQAIIQQYQNYCTSKKCLQCSIGYSILKK